MYTHVYTCIYFLHSDQVAIFDPSLLSVTPAESVANLKYGFDRHSDSEELSTYTIPIAIDTPFYNLDEGVSFMEAFQVLLLFFNK